MSRISSISVILVSFLIILSCSQKSEQIPDQYIDPVTSLYDNALKPFYHDVASGDPLKYTNNRDHGYIILTLTPAKATSEWF